MTSSTPRQILAMCTRSPGQQLEAREGLDAILATAVFGQSVSVLFCGDGIWQLLASQGDFTGSNKALADSLAALPLYDVSDVYADAQSLQERGIVAAALPPFVTVIDATVASELLAESDCIMSF